MMEAQSQPLLSQVSSPVFSLDEDKVKVYEDTINSLKEELAQKDEIIEELTTKLNAESSLLSKAPEKTAHNNSQSSVSLSQKDNNEGKGYKQIHGRGNKGKEFDSKRPGSSTRQKTEFSAKTQRENTEYEASLSKLKEENSKLAKFYKEHKYLEDKLNKSKEHIDTLQRELNYYKEKSLSEEFVEPDGFLQTASLMSQSKLLESQLEHVLGKVDNLAVEICKHKQSSMVDKNDLSGAIETDKAVTENQTAPKLPPIAKADAEKLSKANDELKKHAKELDDKNKENAELIVSYKGRIKELEQHVKDLSEILEEWCTKIYIKRKSIA